MATSKPKASTPAVKKTAAVRKAPTGPKTTTQPPKKAAPAKGPVKKAAAKKAAVTKTAAARKATTTPAKKAAAKKGTPKAVKKTTRLKAVVPPLKTPKPKAAPETAQGSFERLADSSKAFVAQVGATSSVLAHEAVETVTAASKAARSKAQDSIQRTREFVRNHPGEAAGLAATGLTVAGALLGRNKVGSLVKAAAAAGLTAKASTVVSKASKALKDLRKKS